MPGLLATFLSLAIGSPPAEISVPTPSARALRYHRGNNAIWAVGQAWSLALPAAWLATGAARRLGRASLRVSRGPAGASLVFVPIYLAVNGVLTLPMAWYVGYFRQHAYGLSTQSPASWVVDLAKAQATMILLATAATCGVVALIGRFPRRWWLVSAMMAAPALVGTVALKPVLYDPMFNTFRPMADKALEARLLTMAARSGIEGGRVYRVDMGRRTTAVNAYVTGLLGSRRIVLWDTLLEKLDADEVAAVMGHEMGHYALGHVARGVTLACVGNLGMSALAASLYVRACRRCHLGQPGQPATLPILHLILGALMLGATPAANAFSRYQERQADLYALELTGDGPAAARGFAAIQRDNLSVPRPGLWYTFWRATHPSLAERIEAANAYRPPARGLRGDQDGMGGEPMSRREAASDVD